MADSDKSSRTEPATEKRKAEARKQGQVAISRDVGTAAILLASASFLAVTVPLAMQRLTDITRHGLSLSFDESFLKALTVERIHTIVVDTGVTTLTLILPLLGLIMVVGTGASLAQTGLIWRTNAFSLKWDRLNPIAGLGKLLSMRSIMELLKGLLKIGIITGVGLFTARHDLLMVPTLMDYDLHASLQVAGKLVFKVSIGVIGALAVIAGLDYLYQRYEWERDLRMTKEEIKEEHKAAEGDPLIRSRVRSAQRDLAKKRMMAAVKTEEIKEEHKAAEGDPLIRSRVRSAQRDLAKKRMMAAVKTADVVVTNPTHIAVALKYDATKAAAPFVVAKGAGFVAERIRELARHHGVAVVENKFVARTLYKLVDIGKEIPSNLYRAVAEILAFVYRAKGVTPGQL